MAIVNFVSRRRSPFSWAGPRDRFSHSSSLRREPVLAFVHAHLAGVMFRAVWDMNHDTEQKGRDKEQET